MCGICCILYLKGESFPLESCVTHLLSRRGPDHSDLLTECLTGFINSQWLGKVLHMRGPFTSQPLKDKHDNLLLWNGEIFNSGLVGPEQNDGEVLLSMFQQASSALEMLNIIVNIHGPWSFVCWKANLQQLWFSRDFFGRRSLLLNISTNLKLLKIASVVMDSNEDWWEVPADGVYCLQLDAVSQLLPKFTWFPWIRDVKCSVVPVLPEISFHRSADSLFKVTVGEFAIAPDVSTFNRQELSIKHDIHEERLFGVTDELGSTTLPHYLACDELCKLSQVSLHKLANLADQLTNLLREAVKKRVLAQLNRCSLCQEEKGVKNLSALQKCFHAKTGILFSGGLDSLVLAALADQVLPSDEPIDLLNVAFQVKSPDGRETFDAPDRLTGHEGLVVLNKRRHWNFVEINVQTDELKTMREKHIRTLIAPHQTVLDDSIGCALWFAAQGKGLVAGEPYTSPSRVLLVGMGADEQLAGYARHRVQFNKHGVTGLVEEVLLDINRISSRNLGRDDRVISDHGRESRLPYLDESVVSFLNSLPMEDKAIFSLPRGVGEKLLLRLCALSLGLGASSFLPKRAIQFGSRIAKSESRGEKGSEVCGRLA